MVGDAKLSSPNSSSDDNFNTSILVLDNEYDIKLISRSLMTDGLKVCSFTDPLSAVEHLNSDRKDYYHNVVIYDVRMFA
jgi:DNA-binding NtrC family response regulator